MNKIRHNIYLGSWQPATKLEELKSAAITAVLNVALDQNDPDFFNEGITNVKVGLGDCDYNKPHIKQLAIDVLGKILDAGEVVYVNCIAGASRSPYVVGKYLAHKEGKTLQTLITELHQMRPEVFERSPLHDE